MAYCAAYPLWVSLDEGVFNTLLLSRILRSGFGVTPCDVRVTLNQYTNPKSKTANQN
jgi:hypothetical protein